MPACRVSGCLREAVEMPAYLEQLGATLCGPHLETLQESISIAEKELSDLRIQADPAFIALPELRNLLYASRNPRLYLLE